MDLVGSLTSEISRNRCCCFVLGGSEPIGVFHQDDSSDLTHGKWCVWLWSTSNISLSYQCNGKNAGWESKLNVCWGKGVLRILPFSPNFFSLLLNLRRQNFVLERFSFECRKVIGFAFTTLRDWFKKLAPLSHPIRSKTNTNRDSLVRVFPRFASATCNYFVFWLAHLIVCVLCDWLEWLLWFWFYDTQLKTALNNIDALTYFTAAK